MVAGWSADPSFIIQFQNRLHLIDKLRRNRSHLDGDTPLIVKGGAAASLETVKHHLKPNRQRSVGPNCVSRVPARGPGEGDPGSGRTSIDRLTEAVEALSRTQ